MRQRLTVTKPVLFSKVRDKRIYILASSLSVLAISGIGLLLMEHSNWVNRPWWIITLILHLGGAAAALIMACLILASFIARGRYIRSAATGLLLLMGASLCGTLSLIGFSGQSRLVMGSGIFFAAASFLYASLLYERRQQRERATLLPKLAPVPVTVRVRRHR